MSIPADESVSDVFAYTAQTFEGAPHSGTINAVSIDDASQRLANLKLRVIRIERTPRPPRAKPLRGEDFAAFNQQLAHLAAAGLPIEQGLRLIADDLNHGRMAQTVRNVSAELERGVPLGEAFKLHEKQFPPLYGALVEAGVRTGSLPAILLNLGRHLELVARLRAAIWRGVAYPLTVVAGLFVVLIFLGRFVLPQFKLIYRNWYTQLPPVTQALLRFADWTPVVIAIALAMFIGVPLLWMLLRANKLDRAAADLALPLPVFGPLLHRNLIARWCDAMRIAVAAGLDLPAAVHLACDVVGSPALARDCGAIEAQLHAGKPIDQIPHRLRVLPTTVLAVVQLSADRADLPAALETLSLMYQQQAEMRLAALQGAITPALIIVIAFVIGFVVLGLFAPMISIFQVMS